MIAPQRASSRRSRTRSSARHGSSARTPERRRFPAGGPSSRTSPTENPRCNDGLDNDGDGKFDFDGGATATRGVTLGPPDPQCTHAWINSEASSGCGVGAELALVIPLLGLAARRRRRELGGSSKKLRAFDADLEG